VVSRTLSLTLKSESGDGNFKWQHWIDAAMGYMKGWQIRHDDGDVKYERTILRPNLLASMVEVCPLRRFGEGKVERTGVVQIWQGWPAFDLSICKFEVDQWLTACNIDYDQSIVDIEVEHAERVIKAIVQ